MTKIQRTERASEVPPDLTRWRVGLYVVLLHCLSHPCDGGERRVVITDALASLLSQDSGCATLA